MLHEPNIQETAETPDVFTRTSLAMFGERCSGVEHVEDLVKLNFPQLQATDEFGWRHGFINPGYIRDNAVFVVVVRDALDWLREFHSKPLQVAGWHKGLTLSEFIQHEWSGDVRGRVLGKPNRKLNLSRHAELMTERHPLTGERIRNVIEMRNLKLQSLLKLQKMTDNVAFIRYEDVRDAPEEMMGQLQERLGLPRCEEVLQIEENRADETSLAEFSEEDLTFIASELDLPQERAFGYTYELPVCFRTRRPL